MSNKTSDKNVANIEDDIKTLIEENPSYKKEQAIEHILAELEQKDKRIQELEEELEEFNKQLDLDYVDENFISKQAVIDKIEDLKTKRRELCFKTYLRREDMLNDDRMIVCGIQILQELLEGAEK